MLAILAAPAAHADDVFGKRWGPWIEVGAQVGGNRALGEANLFVPLHQNRDTLVFADVRGMFDDRDAVEGNFGLGVRHMLPGGWNIGGYGYFDIRRSALGNSFHQVTLGAEALGEVFDIRANAYLPVGTRERLVDLGTTTTVAGSSRPVLTGTSLAIETGVTTTTTASHMVEKALAGFDAEVGFRLPVFARDSGFDLRAFFGGYYFDASGVDRIAGPRARLELTASDFAGLPGVKLTGGLTYQHDDVRGDQWIAQARLRLPLQAPSARSTEPLSYMERRMTDAVVRDVDIVSNTGGVVAQATQSSVTSTEAAVNTWNGTVVTSVTTVDGAAGHQGLQGELDARGEGAVVVLTGDLAAPAGIVIGAGRTLIGGGTALRVRGAATGVEVDYVAAGTTGKIAGQGTRPTGALFTGLVNLGNRSVVGGLMLTQSSTTTSNSVINAYQASGAVAFGNTVQGVVNRTFSHGIMFETSSDGIAYGNVVRAGPQDSSFGLAAIYDSKRVLFDSNDAGTDSPNATSLILQNGSSGRVVNNTFRPIPVGTVIRMFVGSEILPGSTGNTIIGSFAARCDTAGAPSSGTVEFTNAAPCVYP